MKTETCESCAKKKRKCGGEQPSCQNCITIGIDCLYADSKRPGPKPGRSKALEDRLRKLEAIVEMLNLDETTTSDNQDSEPLRNFISHPGQVIPASPAMSLAAFPSHIDNLRPDLEELFLSTSAGYLFLDANQTRKALQESVFLRFAVYALAAGVAPPQMVPSEFSSRSEMAELYFKRAESFLRRIFRKPSYHGVIGLFGLVVYCTRTEKGPEAFYYYTVAVRIALSLGLNKEKVYERNGLTEEQKETMRCTWWTLYLGDRLLSALRFEPPLIQDSDCRCLLPRSTAVYTHPQDDAAEVQLSLMANAEWYVPSPKQLAPHCYLIILTKIHSRIITLSQESKEFPTSFHQYAYREHAILGSLRDWYSAIPDCIRFVLKDVSGDTPPTDPQSTWFYAFIMILYNCIRIYAHKRKLFDNIQQNVVLAASSTAARETFLAGCDMTAILQGFLRHNPSFFYAPPFVASSVFGAGLMIMVISRLALNPNDIAICQLNLQTTVACLNQHSILYNIGTAQKQVLEKLQTCHDPVLLMLALKSMKNMKGEVLPDRSAQMISLEAEDPVSPDPDTFAYLSTAKQQEILENVAKMSNPYSDLMVGVQVKEDLTFDQLFNFSDARGA